MYTVCHLKDQAGASPILIQWNQIPHRFFTATYCSSQTWPLKSINYKSVIVKLNSMKCNWNRWNVIETLPKSIKKVCKIVSVSMQRTWHVEVHVYLALAFQARNIKKRNKENEDNMQIRIHTNIKYQDGISRITAAVLV